MKKSHLISLLSPSISALSSLRIVTTVAAALLGGLIPVNASTLYWNADNGGSGDWNSTSTAWGTDVAGPPDTAWSSSADATDIARFAFAGGTLSLTEALGAGGLQFDVDGYTINAASTTSLQLNDSRGIDVESGATATLGSGVRITGGSAAEVGFTKTGEGTLVIQGSSFYVADGFSFADRRDYNIEAGTMRVESAAFNNTRHTFNISSGATVDMHNSLQLGSLNGNGVLTNTSASMATLGQRQTGGVFNGVISGNIDLATTSLGSQINIPEFTLGGNDPNTFTGNVNVSRIAYLLNKPDGVTALSGDVLFSNANNLSSSTAANRPRVTLMANEQIANNALLSFNGVNTGEIFHDMLFQLNGFSERMGTLEIGAASNHSGFLDFGLNSVAQYLWFSEFVVNNVDSPPVIVTHFIEEEDSLRFDTNPQSNLAWLKFFDGDDLINATASFDAENNYWLVTPIPEPASYALLLAVVSALALRMMRRIRGSISI